MEFLNTVAQNQELLRFASLDITVSVCYVNVRITDFCFCLWITLGKAAQAVWSQLPACGTVFPWQVAAAGTEPRGSCSEAVKTSPRRSLKHTSVVPNFVFVHMGIASAVSYFLMDSSFS